MQITVELKRLVPKIVLSAAVVSSTMGQTWTKIIPASPSVPAPRTGATAVYDPVGKRMLLFGGRDGTVYFNDVWAFDFNSRMWSPVGTTGSLQPSPRSNHIAIYDSARQRMIVWSGQTTGGVFADARVWELDLFSLTWRVLAPAGAVLPRYGSASIYNPHGDRLVIFGGFSNIGQSDETFSFDLIARTWIRLIPFTFTPRPRSMHSAAYDPVNNRMIIYGGQTFTYEDDLWAFSFLTSRWDSLRPPAVPAGRYLSSIVTTRDNQILLFGGRTAAGFVNDVWQYSIARNKWTRHTVSGPQPEPREGHTAIYRPEEDKMVIFGGSGAGTYNDLWEFTKPVTLVKERLGETPKALGLLQNYPNPFNTSTQITFSLPRDTYVILRVYNLLGNEIATLIDGWRSAGIHSVTWNAEGTPSGVYVCRLEAGTVLDVIKMVLMK